MRIFVLTCLLAGSLAAQETRTEVTKATTPANDAKENSSDVPDVYTTSGEFKRVLVLRFKYQADLLAGIEETVKKEKIQHAVILSGIGSVRNYHVHSVSNRTFPSKNMFVKNVSAPADIIGMNGYVIDGKVHAHLTMSNAEKAFGGHLEPGTSVFTFAIVTLGELSQSADLSRADDKTFR